MPRSLGVFKRDPSDVHVLIPSPIVAGDVVYCITGNGRDILDAPVPSPDAPSFIAVNKHSGTVIWANNAPGPDILYGQWSTPARAIDEGKEEILFPGGDGFLYALNPTTGAVLWKIDCNDGKRPASFIVAPLVVEEGTVYVSLNRDFEQGFGIPHALLSLSIARRRVVWRFQDAAFDGTFGCMAVDAKRLYAAGHGGALVALDKASGRKVWQVVLPDLVDGGACLNSDKLYVAAGATVHVIDPLTGRRVVEYEFPDLLTGTPIVVGKKMFVCTQGTVMCVQLVE
jgi:outer membrane protein assembly factor BamB